MNKRYLFGGIAIVALLVIGWFALGNSAIEYTDLAKAAKLGSTVQVVGTWVKEEGSRYDQQHDVFYFTMQDKAGRRIPVELAGSKPNNFEIAVSVVVKGRVEQGRMKAQHVRTNCPSKYEGQSAGA
jgi:cytochrome c-type biogenesis protein CcmE